MASYGEWASPITGADIAGKQVGLSYPTVIGSRVWWQESRPSEGGRLAVVCHEPEGGARDLLPMPWNARNRVHEYGGRSYLPVPGGLVFANFADQRLYHCPDTGGTDDPMPLTPPGDRFADFVLSPDGDEVWCVRERHGAGADAGGRVRRAIVAVPLDGSAADAPDAVRVLVSGSDFYASPAPSPDGTRLAWICWDHPRMPWDGTELRVGRLGEGVEDQKLIMGGETESVLAPVWHDDRSLYAISDRSGWWNLYLTDTEGRTRALCPREEEFAAPLWQLGMSPYAVLDDGRIAVTHGTGERRLGLLDPDTGELTDLDLPYRVFMSSLSGSGRTVAVIAGGPALPLCVAKVGVPPNAGQPPEVREVRREADSLPDAEYLPVPREYRLAGPSGSVVHAFVYPPANPGFRAPDGELPPYIVWVHGGPTSHVVPRLDLEKAFFTSRGIGIIDVNYGGSSGYGRAYRERLRGQWGIVDVTDAMAAALGLAKAGEADGKRLGIRGASAGGWTALAAVTSGLSLDGHGFSGASGVDGDGRRRGVFAAATSYFGVSDLRGFAAQTHDFESRYLDGLIGPLPKCEELYAERAPVGHVDGATCPVLLLQGLDDPIVPPVQSETIAADLAAHGIPHAYLAFAGESHGFRKAESIVASLEAELSFYGQIMGFTPPGIPPVPLSAGEGSGG